RGVGPTRLARPESPRGSFRVRRSASRLRSSSPFAISPAMLAVTDLTYRIAGRTLLDGASVVVPAKAKAGLVGRNGTGKTTLFRLLAGEIAPESGTITLPARARIGRVAQEAPGTDETLLGFVLKADVERTGLLAEAETA